MNEQECPKCGNPHMMRGVDIDLKGTPGIWWCLNCGLEGRNKEEMETKTRAIAQRIARDTTTSHSGRQAKTN